MLIHYALNNTCLVICFCTRGSTEDNRSSCVNKLFWRVSGFKFQKENIFLTATAIEAFLLQTVAESFVTQFNARYALMLLYLYLIITLIQPVTDAMLVNMPVFILS